MSNRSLTGLALAVTLFCGSVVAVRGVGTAAGRAVKVGVIADVTGPAAAYGTSQKNAYDLAADDLRAGRLDAGGAALTFDVEDAASDPAQVVTLMQKFSSDGSALVIGPTLSAEAKKADPIAVRAGVTILATSNTARGITAQGPCVFRDSLAEEQVVPEAIARVAAVWRPRTAAIIYGDDNEFTKTDYEIFTRSLERRRIAVVDVETYHTGDVDFKAQLTNIAAKHPDVLVVGALLEEAVKIVVQAKRSGVRAHTIGGNGLNSPRFGALAGDAGEGVVIGAAYDLANAYAGNRGFVERYRAKFGVGPDQFAAQAYAAAQIVTAAVRDGASASDRFCTTFKKRNIFATVLGPVAFQDDRDVRAASAIVRVTKDGFANF